MIEFDNLGAIGIIKDVPAHELTQMAWTEGQNVRFVDGSAEKIKGHSRVFDSSTASGSIAITPYHLLAVQASTDYYWVYSGLNAVYATDGATHTDISGATYSATANVKWNGGVLGGIGILNNGKDLPQQWGDNSAVPSLTKPLKDLENWPAGTRCNVIRPYKEFLVAMDITEPGENRNRELLRWSHPADPGTVPSTWDYTDPTNDSGRVEIARGNGGLVDGLVLRDTFIIYKQYSTLGMQFIGAPNQFRFYTIFDQSGILSEDCAQEFFGRHFVVTDGDVIIHDGHSFEPVLRQKYRKALFNDIDSTYFNRSFVVANNARSEMWICYVETGTTNANTDLIQPNKAVVWNWRENTTTVRELPGVSYAVDGIIDTTVSSGTFDADSGTFDSDTSGFNDLTYRAGQRQVLMAHPNTTSRLYVADDSDQFDSANMTAYVQREALPLGRALPDGSRKIDLLTIKYIRSLYPRITGTIGGTVNFYVGYQMELSDAITWTAAIPFVIGTDYKIDTRVTGRILSIKAETTTNITWKLTGIGIDVILQGIR